MGMYQPPPEKPSIIAGPGTHTRLLITAASEYLRRKDMSKAFQSYNSAIEFIRQELVVSPATATGKTFADLFKTWESFYSGPVEAPCYFVGPPGVEEGPGYWEAHKMRLTRIGTVWAGEAKATAIRLGNMPPLRYVCGAVPWVDLESQVFPSAGTPIAFFGGCEAEILTCWSFIEEGGEQVSRALRCHGNCLECPHGLLTGKTFVLNRLELGEYKRLSNTTRNVLVKLALRVEHFVSRYYGVGGGVEEPITFGGEDEGEEESASALEMTEEQAFGEDLTVGYREEAGETSGETGGMDMSGHSEEEI